MNGIRILGVQVTQRLKNASEVQDVLSRYGCSVKTRLGIHEFEEHDKDSLGLLILELTGDIEEADGLEKNLEEIEGLVVRRMDFPG